MLCTAWELLLAPEGWSKGARLHLLYGVCLSDPMAPPLGHCSLLSGCPANLAVQRFCCIIAAAAAALLQLLGLTCGVLPWCLLLGADMEEFTESDRTLAIVKHVLVDPPEKQNGPYLEERSHLGELTSAGAVCSGWLVGMRGWPAGSPPAWR